MDKLLNSAIQFNKLLNVEYQFSLGRKGRLYEFTLGFDSSDFHHLAGLHKLRDLNWLRKNRERIFKDIISKSIKHSDIESSLYFSDISERLYSLSQLERMLDSQDTVFIWLKNKTWYSNIDADYLIVCKNNNDDMYLFVKKGDNINNKVKAVSFFSRETQDYTQGQVRTALLKKVKKDKRTKNSIVLIDNFKNK